MTTFDLQELLAVLRPRKIPGADDMAPSGSSMDSFIWGEQKTAWRTSGIDCKVTEPTFPFSGYFDPPEQLECDLALSLQHCGNVVARPIIQPEILTTHYQEKVSLPFIYAAWFRLASCNLIPNTLQLGKTIFLASAPTGKIYPVAFQEWSSKNYAIIFDANLLLFYRVFLMSLVTICYDPDADPCPEDPFYINWGRNFRFDRSPTEPFYYNEELDNISTLLSNIAISSLPLSDKSAKINLTEKQNVLISLITDDIYTYLIGHEIGHISQGDLEESCKLDPTATEKEKLIKELYADVYGFSLLANTISLSDGNLRTYVHATIFYHVMSFLYRTIHLLHFRRDYSEIKENIMHRLYFPETSSYPHPLTRLYSLRREIRGFATTVPENLDQLDQHMDGFFEDLWKPICIRLNLAKHPVGEQWSHIIEYHERGYGGDDTTAS